MNSSGPIFQVLDAARWAPSGDNAQPWQFEILDERRFVVHGHDTSDHCVYDLDGWPSQLAIGALVETAAIAASAHGLALVARARSGMPADRPTFDIALEPRPDVRRDPLVDVITVRATQRRALSTRPVDDADRHQLEAAVGPDYELQWHLGSAQRRRWAGLVWSNAGMRLRLPEAFEVHRSIIDWGVRFSEDKMPADSMGVGPVIQAIMRSGMQSRRRLEFLNKWLGGTILPRLLMDLIPCLNSAGHVVVLARRPAPGLEGAVAGGRAMQRFWLTATKLGLQHQPQMTPLIFRRYVVEGRRFTADPSLQALAERLRARLEDLLQGQAQRAVWMGRVGYGPVAESRSTRKPLSQLLMAPVASMAAERAAKASIGPPHGDASAPSGRATTPAGAPR